MRTLIIEDELPASRQLTKLLQQHLPNFELLHTVDSVTSAVDWLSSNLSPELIFMDIQIADGLSFDIFKQVNVTAPVIFTTAFDQYAVQAFKVNALDYVLKPIDPDDLRRALDKVTMMHLSPVQNDWSKLLHLFEKQSYKDRFLVKSGQQFILLHTEEVAYFRSSGGLTQAYTHAGKKHFIEHTLDELERMLAPSDYFRISRGIVIGVKGIKAIHPHLNGRLKLDLAPALSEETFVSRERVGDFKSWLGG